MTHPRTATPHPTSGAAPGSAVPRYLLAVLGTAVCSGLAASVMFRSLERPKRPQGAVPSQVAPAPQPGSVAVTVPASLQDQPRITLLRSGKPAQSQDGTRLARLSPVNLAGEELKPGAYVVEAVYRSRRILRETVQVQPGASSYIELPAREFARVEYQAGLAADARRSGDGIPYFRRAVKLDPENVDAHLQLAAYELVHGSAEAVRNHLRAIHQVDPDNRDAALVERLLQKRLARGR